MRKKTGPKDVSTNVRKGKTEEEFEVEIDEVIDKPLILLRLLFLLPPRLPPLLDEDGELIVLVCFFNKCFFFFVFSFSSLTFLVCFTNSASFHEFYFPFF